MARPAGRGSSSNADSDRPGRRRESFLLCPLSWTDLIRGDSYWADSQVRASLTRSLSHRASPRSVSRRLAMAQR
ncbi:hypothetical protein FHR84_002107 [Actinopolyspora biskrensis]|uniref:Uncharacterized protein n=1 Tax=Actinopolyspora biskrensis TaxID=1470178 RepID=A0A852YYI2_9ACTN|nr:hypothetical protein [Actinopolyspora biskrensis]NYH78782.1 hypothetical protein [Actinopolyspora biskrensis]